MPPAGSTSCSTMPAPAARASAIDAISARGLGSHPGAAAALGRAGHPLCRAADDEARRRRDRQHLQRFGAAAPGYAPTAYSVAKAGVLHLTKIAAADLARHNIRVNAVVPGLHHDQHLHRLARHRRREARHGQCARSPASPRKPSRSSAPAGPRTSPRPSPFSPATMPAFVTGTHILVDGGHDDRPAP